MLKRGVERSYNRLSVDGDTSTNDTLVLLANGASGVRPDPKELAKVEEAIAAVMEALAQAIARDGEGAQEVRHHRGDGGAQPTMARRAHRARHRQFAAGEDGDRGLRPELGAHSFARRAMREWRSIRPRPISSMQDVAVCRGGLAAPFSEAELKTEAGRAGVRDPGGDSREGQGRGALLDVRSHRRLHPDQRQLPDLR